MIWEPAVECLPRAQLERLQGERLRQSVRWCLERVPFYRETLGGAGFDPRAIRGVADVARLPFSAKPLLREQYPFGLLAVPLTEVRRIHASSGTRGKPTVVGYTVRDLETWSVCNAEDDSPERGESRARRRRDRAGEGVTTREDPAVHEWT